jgi:SAM-dependent methyltransferase
MTLSKFLAKQLGNPSGIMGKFAAFVWNRRNAALNDAVFDMLALEPSDRVLEIGFGGGYLLDRVSTIVTDGLLAGVDVSPAMVALCENRFRNRIREGKLELKRAAAESLPYPPKSFSKVCSTNSIYYWQDVGGAIGEIERVLRPGGELVLGFTCKDSLAKRNFARHIRLVEAEEIQTLMLAEGFQNIQTVCLADPYRRFYCVTGKKSISEFQG